ncbi:MAG: T9SS type A sorting domain-containing protein, partial [bacterium]
PAGSTVTVSADFALQRVDLYNTSGALVLSLPASGNQMDISLEGLHPGTYVVAVATAAGTATRKLTVER